MSRYVKFFEEKSYYEEKERKDLEDLSRPSYRATSLRQILEGLGIGVSQDQQEEHSSVVHEAEEPSHIDHEGGNENEADNHEDQDLNYPDQSGHKMYMNLVMKNTIKTRNQEK